MSRYVFALLAILVIVSATAASEKSPECPPNEIWNQCGSACPPTCKKPDPGPCTLQCVPQCQCMKGLLRNSKGKCVKPSKCC